MKKIAIFASGSGTNAENIIRYFRTSPSAEVALLLCNKPGAKVLERAERLGTPTIVFDREMFTSADGVLKTLQNEKIDYIVLAGFLWLIPLNIIKAYEGRIINIHPALLPRHGGKGMYGSKVHEAVVAAGDTETGITIHKVDEVYDNGTVIAQYAVPVAPEDTPEKVAQKVHALEYEHYPKEIESEVIKLI